MRGDVYRIKAPRATVGREQKGHRFAIVVQSDFVQTSTLLVAPTSTSAHASDYRPEIEIDEYPTRVLVEQAMAVDLSRLSEFAGRLEPEELRAVDTALKLVFGLR